mgnify:FL=1
MINHKFLTAALIFTSLPASNATLPRGFVKDVKNVSSNTIVEKLPIQQPLQIKMPSEGAPRKRKGGGARNPVCDVQPSLTALIPLRGLGLTHKSREFWFYVPYQASTGYSAEFQLQDNSETGNKIYSKTFKFENTPGIINIPLPRDIKLDSNKFYKWQLSVIANPQDRNDDCFVSGGVKQVPLPPDVSNKLKMAKTPRERIAIYAENALWHDVLSNLIELRRQNPDNETLKSDWNDLLKHRLVRLEDIVSKPIVSCCESEPEPQ